MSKSVPGIPRDPLPDPARFTSPQASTGERDEQRGVIGNYPPLDPDPRPSTSRDKREQPLSGPIMEQ